MIALTAPLPSLPRAATSARSGRGTIEDSLEGRASRGDRRALEALLREHARAVHDLCRYLAGPTEGRDAAQESLEKIVTSIARFDPTKGSFRGWALTLARNVCRDRLRRRGLERRTFVGEGDEVTATTASEAPDVERVALARIESRRLAAALETLPEGMRLAIVLFHVHDSTYEEIATALEIPIGTVMTWLHRGRKRLRVALESDTTTGGEP
ncbi:RNA polymerase sigma factor [Sandaracinus amylolyticus]|uniref:RNA polymerase sigma factor SigW n=1 Tax=Sandaracinus amylolyticus TaxID=927083 RepID=A0A0F6YH26_9BACT|nr:RNA polymerase sigma factor [Sandaracinus amylolyticus]AKF05376.1 RNA polymerase sigma factor SigW [Sandaracinus amylolyticus]